MIAVCGEALIDLVPAGEPGLWRAIPGGGPANTAVALARLGTPSSLLCRLSGDGFGARIRAHLEANGVDLSWAPEAAEQSSVAVADLDDKGAARYGFYLRGTADWQWSADELPERLPEDTACLHVGSLAAVLPPGDAVLRDWARTQRDSVAVCYDVNVRPAVRPDADAYRESVRAWLDLAHIVKVSDDDLAWLAPGERPTDVVRGWMERYGLWLGVLTLGKDGAVAVLPGGESIAVPGVHVEVADTVGAGDAFIAAMLAELEPLLPRTQTAGAMDIDGAQVEPALRFATAAAALACTRSGAHAPDRGEVDSLMAATGHAHRDG
ncbi:MAG: carbohydrate kinase [Nocardiopsaceae bacterium]|nr:carbohydrate kinase [Nocardiopsaceae bacterium]